MKNLDNYHILQVKCLGATNYRPARVKIISERFRQSVIIPFTNDPGASSPTLHTAQEWLENKGHVIIGKGEGKNCYYIISDTFVSLKK